MGSVYVGVTVPLRPARLVWGASPAAKLLAVRRGKMASAYRVGMS